MMIHWLQQVCAATRDVHWQYTACLQVVLHALCHLARELVEDHEMMLAGALSVQTVTKLFGPPKSVSGVSPCLQVRGGESERVDVNKEIRIYIIYIHSGNCNECA